MEDVPAPALGPASALASAPDLVLVEVPSAQMTAPQMMVPTSEVVLHRRDHAPVHDWDLLSSGFQLEAAGYLQIVAFVAVFFWLKFQGKLLLGGPLWRPEKDEEQNVNADGPGETQSGGMS